MQIEVKRMQEQQYSYQTKQTFKQLKKKKTKKGHYLIIKGSIQIEDITIINIYAPYREAPKYIKQVLVDIKEEIHTNAKTVGDFNNPCTSVDRSSRQKINK